MRTARNRGVALTLAGGAVLACLTACAPMTMPTPVQITGEADQALEPGSSIPLDLVLINRHPVPIDVTDLTVEIVDIYAPFSDSNHPCTPEDYTIAQPRSSVIIGVAAQTTLRLSASTLPRTEWPWVQMRDRDSDQIGCRGASLTLRFSARTATVIAR